MTTTARPGLADIKLTSDGLTGTLIVNGEVVQGVQEVQVKAGLDENGVREVTQVWVRMAAGVDFDGQGVVHVVHETDPDHGEIIRAWLQDIDGDELLTKAADSLGFGDDPGMGPAIVRALQELAG